ncbi:MAG: cytochrome c, partial [Janthinobacterium sp.]
KRGDKANGRNNAIMTGQVKPLSNQDIKDLAAYLHSLPTTLVIHR